MKLKKLLASVTAAALALTTMATTSFIPSISAETRDILTLYKSDTASFVPDQVPWTKEAIEAFTEDVTSITVTVDGTGRTYPAGIMTTTPWAWMDSSDNGTIVKNSDDWISEQWVKFLDAAVNERDIAVSLEGYTSVNSVSVTFDTTPIDDDEDTENEAAAVSLEPEDESAEPVQESDEPAVSEAQDNDDAAENNDEAVLPEILTEDFPIADIADSRDEVMTLAAPKTIKIYEVTEGIRLSAGAGINWAVERDKFSSIETLEELLKCRAEVTFNDGGIGNVSIIPGYNENGDWESGAYGWTSEGSAAVAVIESINKDAAYDGILERGMTIAVGAKTDLLITEVKFVYDSELEGSAVHSVPSVPEGYETVVSKLEPAAVIASFPAHFVGTWSHVEGGSDDNGLYVRSSEPIDASVLEDENVYVKVEMSGIGNLINGDINPDVVPYDEILAGGFDDYSWCYPLFWHGKDDEEIFCNFAPVETSTAAKAVAYAPISVSAGLLDKDGYLGGIVMSGWIDKVTVDSMSIVRFSDEIIPDEPGAEIKDLLILYKSGFVSPAPQQITWTKEAREAFTEDVTSITVTVDGTGRSYPDYIFVAPDWASMNFSENGTIVKNSDPWISEQWGKFLAAAAGNGNDIQVSLIGYTAVKSVSVTFNRADETAPKTVKIYDYNEGIRLSAGSGINWAVERDKFSSIETVEDLIKCRAEVTFKDGGIGNVSIIPGYDDNGDWSSGAYGWTSEGSAAVAVIESINKDAAYDGILERGMTIAVGAENDLLITEVKFVYDSELEGSATHCVPSVPEGYETVVSKLEPVTVIASFPAHFVGTWSNVEGGSDENGLYVRSSEPIDASVLEDENVYVKVEMSGIGNLINGDINPDVVPYDEILAGGFDDYSWCYPLFWHGKDDEEIFCNFAPVETSTAAKAVAYAPISISAGLLDKDGYLGGIVKSGWIDEVTVDSMSIVRFSGEIITDDDTGIVLEDVDGNTIDPDVELDVQTVPKDDVVEDIEDEVLIKVRVVVAYDITLTKDGVEIQPDGKIKVTIPCPVGVIYGRNAKVYHIADGKTVDMNAVFDPETNTLTFITDHFSIYAVTDDKSSGDVNNDNVFDIDDVIDLARSLLSSSSENPYVSVADLDYNDVIDIDDVILLARALITK